MKYKLKVLKLADVKVGERYRDDFGNIEELMESIKEKGVLQPITVNNDMLLLAGERRYTACFNLKLEEIPALVVSTQDELDEREIELMENLQRKDFNWTEQAKLTARIHELYKEKSKGTELWSERKTAQIIDQSPMTVNRALKLAHAIDVLPSIAECKTAADALKVLNKAEEQQIVAELAKRQQTLVLTAQGPSATPKEKGLASTLKVARDNYIIGDTFKYMSHMKANSHFDFIECDPPYGVDLAALTAREENTATVGQRDGSYHEISEKEYPEFLARLCNETFRIAGRDCWMVFWFAFRWHGEVLTSLQNAGWVVDSVPALWTKGTGRTPRPIFFWAVPMNPSSSAVKGNLQLLSRDDSILSCVIPTKKSTHPAQRPIGLMEDILSTFLDGMKNVLVPFAGSGATLRACYKTGHKVIGFDTNDEYKNHFLLAVEEDTKKMLGK